ncbi:ATP-binding cassette domain-containing protein [Mucilaginibacter myungsuensis]|uniref:ATP-binding cassette domain-containing protein n=1 Tax=Mucilaginibacter myungsuensis TaxID=649104 RepID=A0A929KX78_9SPHI|nr:ATP-binding cassette domain-containing protein [Mucilaginibacter myungsuensis]MBE9660330.1 ATP-binding cassette domain-containing protein [Mucilaginibacter myungsuensis]MDN3600372.1 ATP-binding cassette domain-containing protein [Mucilaginibacter myungsuensis]
MIAIDIHKKLKIGKGWSDLHVQLQAERGTITVIHGPSGAGKSTFLKVLAGLIKPETGSISVDGDVWLDTSSRIDLSPQQRKAGFVFQNYALFPNMTVKQHLQYATNDAAWIDELLSLGQLQTFADQKPDDLSGGQQQRLAILRAMAIKPKLLLMDEPFSALDQKTKADLLAGLKILWDKLQTTVIIVSHYPDELKDIADHQLYVSYQ